MRSSALIHGVLVVALALLLGSERPASAEPPLKLEDAIRLALTRNERAQIADLGVVVAGAAVDKARTAFLPVLSVSGSDLQRPYDVTRNGAIVTPSNIATGSVTLTQPVVNAPAFPLYGQAKHQLEGQKLSTAESKRQLAFDAARGFLAVLSVEQVLLAARERLKLAQANLDYAQARADAQLASSNDVTRSQLELANAQHEIAQDQGQVDRARVQLEFLLNAKVEPPIAPPDALLEASQKSEGDVSALVAAAQKIRLDVKADRELAVAARLFAEEPLLRLVPSLSLVAQFHATSDPGSSRWDDETLTLNLNWTAYDGGVRYADRRSRKASANIADLTLELLRRSVENDVRVALANLSAAQGAFRAARDAVAAARKSSEETGVLYQQGVARAIELTDANTQRFEAEVNLVGAQYAMEQSELDLRTAMGLDPLEPIP